MSLVPVRHASSVDLHGTAPLLIMPIHRRTLTQNWSSLLSANHCETGGNRSGTSGEPKSVSPYVPLHLSGRLAQLSRPIIHPLSPSELPSRRATSSSDGRRPLGPVSAVSQVQLLILPRLLVNMARPAHGVPSLRHRRHLVRVPPLAGRKRGAAPDRGSSWEGCHGEDAFAVEGGSRQ